jgi:hypothetical protein
MSRVLYGKDEAIRFEDAVEEISEELKKFKSKDRKSKADVER